MELPLIATTTIMNTPVELVTYYDKAERQNYLAIYHDDYRHVWIAQNPPSLYAHSRMQGERAKNDTTCYYEPHHNWGEQRGDWPDSLFQYEPPYRPRLKKQPDWLYTSEGWLVLDSKRQPMRDYKMPLTLASICDDFVCEAIMRDNYHEHILVQDLLARMPGKTVNGREPHRVGTVSMRMNRFRDGACCITWAPKVGSEAKKAYMDSILPEACKKANSTREFRSLHAHEIAKMEMINVGQFPNKARQGKKDFSEANRNAKYQEKRKKFLKLEAEFYGMSPPDAAGELQDLDMDVDMFDVPQNPHLVDSPSATTDVAEMSLQAAFGSTGSPTGSYFTSVNLPNFTSPSPSQSPSFLHAPPTTQILRTLHTLLLAPTLHHFSHLTHSPPPITSDTCSYAQQLTHLQWALDNFLAENGAQETFHGLRLVGLTVWTSEEIVWNLEWDFGAYGRMVDLGVVERLMGGV